MGSDTEILDLSGGEDDGWVSVEDYENTLDIEVVEFQPSPPQMPRGYKKKTTGSASILQRYV